MSAPIATFETNTEPGSIKDVCLHCDALWMLGQQEAILRLCVPDRSKFATPGQMELIRSFSARAARIAAFSTACDVDDPDLRVQMEAGDLYNEADRMSFINEVAKQYHRLMQTKTLYIETQIAAIAGWNSTS